MAEQNIENFWNFFDDQLKHYMTLFNDDMGPKGFQVGSKIVYKIPIGVIYVLMMYYKEYSAHRGDVLLISMYVPQEVIRLKELLHDIQE